jgi:hypothetical protein
MKKFKDLFAEDSPATDYVPEKDEDEEVTSAKPRSRGEEEFLNAHVVSVTKHPVAFDHQFDGTIPPMVDINKTFKQFSTQKEEVEYIDETFKKGILKLKSGEKVKVNENDAKLLNTALKELTGTNKKRMTTETIKNKSSFNSMIQFAKGIKK